MVHVVSERWLIRTRLSGVWVDAEIIGTGPYPGDYRIRGRRLHRWTGGRLACGDLARLGAPDGSRIEAESSPVLRFEDTAERHVMTERALAQTRSVPDWSEQ